MNASPPRYALVTGASAGIGRELARCFAADGYHLLLVARSRDRLESQATQLAHEFGISAEALVYDLTDPVAPQKLHEELLGRGISIDALVNNAGFGIPGRFTDNDPDRLRDMLQVNINGLTQLLQLFLPDMVTRGHGEILNVGSTAGFQPGPNQAAYFASKAYVNSLTEALAGELGDYPDIKVTCLCPGPTATNFAAVAGMEESLNFRFGVMQADQVARAGYRGLKRGRAVVIPGWKNRLLTFSVRLSPRFVVRHIARRLNT